MTQANQIRNFAGDFREFKPEDRQFNALVDDHNRLANAVRNMPFMDGVLLPNQSLAGGADNIITHGLGRTFRGAFLFGQTNNAGGAAWTAYTATVYDKTQKINIKPDAAYVGDIWVF
jgi:hypothetical protein